MFFCVEENYTFKEINSKRWIKKRRIFENYTFKEINKKDELNKDEYVKIILSKKLINKMNQISWICETYKSSVTELFKATKAVDKLET